MGEQNVEILRQYFEAVRDGLDFDRAEKYLHPEINYRALEGAPDDIGEFTGHAAMRAYLQQSLDTFDDFRAEADELIDRGDVVVARIRVIGRMKGSDAELEMPFAAAYKVRDGLVVKGREYATVEEALAAADAWSD